MPGDNSKALITHVGVAYPWQCDQVGHLNVASYVAKFDEATWNLFSHLGMNGAYFREKRGGMAAVEQKLTYERELHPGDCLEISSKVLEVRPRVITFLHEMTDAASGKLVATCTITAVHIDAAERRASPFPGAIFDRALELVRTT